MPRVARIAPGGMVFHVLNRGNARGEIFDGAGDFAAFEAAMADAHQAVPLRILSFVVMPNHWHLVLWPRADGQLGAFMQRLTVTHVRRWHAHRGTGGTGHLYQGSYKSFPVEDDEHFLTVCRYVERNPLRAHLVERAEKWRWSSLWRREFGDAKLLRLLSDWPVERPANWVNHVNRAQTAREVESLRQCIRRGQPYGREVWQKRIATRLGLESTFNPRGRPRK